MSTYQPTNESPQVFEREGITHLIQQLIDQVTHLFHQEVELVKAEGREGVKKIAWVSAFGGLALLFSIMLILFLGVSLMVYLFVQGMTLWGAALITAGAYLLLALIFAGLGYWRLKAEQPDMFVRKSVNPETATTSP